MRSRMIDRPPPPGLRSGIRRCTGYEETSEGLISRREAAQDGVTLIFNLGPPMRVGGPGEPMRERTSFIAPMNGAYGVTESEGLSRGIQVDLEPAFAHRLLAVPMHELESVVVPLEEILGRRYLELIERLADAPCWSERFEILEAGIRALSRRGPEPAPDLEFAWRSLQRSGGRIPIGRLAAEIGCSRRHLGNRFREQIGLPPKQAARLIRFNRAVERLGNDGGDSFAEIAADAGYFDQPHMNREFLEFAGTPPGRFLSSALPDAPGFAIDPRFPSVQDRAATAA